jgi:hypothetical protein
MLYTPIPGTPLFAEHMERGTMLDLGELSPADTHGQLSFNFHHPHIKNGEETEFLIRAFKRDFQVNGPSVIRIIRTVLMGWQRYKQHTDPRIRARFAHEAANLPVKYAGVLWAARRAYRHNAGLAQQMTDILDEIYREFGWKSRLMAPLAGRHIYRLLRNEERRLANGWTYEPPTYYESNRTDDPHGAEHIQGVVACNNAAPHPREMQPAGQTAREHLADLKRFPSGPHVAVPRDKARHTPQ